MGRKIWQRCKFVKMTLLKSKVLSNTQVSKDMNAFACESFRYAG